VAKPILDATLVERRDLTDTLAAWLSPPRLVVPATALAAAAGVFVVSGGQLPSLEQSIAPIVQSSPPASAARLARAETPRAATAAKKVPRASAVMAAPRADAALDEAKAPEPLLAHAQPRPVVTPNATLQPVSANPSAADGGASGSLQQAKSLAAASPSQASESVGREHLLGMRLEQLQRNPAQFAGWIGSRSLAERDLWLTQFARFSSERGIGGAVLQALRGSQDPRLESAAVQFAAALEETADDAEVAPLP